MNLTSLPDNASITNISNKLVKKNTWYHWYIVCDYEYHDKIDNEKKSDFTKIRFSNAPILAKGRIYNAIQYKNFNKNQEVVDIKFSDLSNYILAKNGQTPTKTYFDYHLAIKSKKSSLNQTHIRIPKFELARILFFHNSYLAISALEERGLERDFIVEKKEDKYILTVLPHCGITKALFESPSFRMALVFIMLNSHMRKSYESIHQNLMQHKIQKKDWKNWNFNFEPPSLKDFTMQVKGHFDVNKIFYVDEILSLKGINSEIKNEVEFQGEMFVEENISVSTSENNTSPSTTTGTVKIDDNQTANSDLKPTLIKTPQVIFDFITPIVTAIKPHKSVNKTVVHTDNQEVDGVEPTDMIVATDEPTIFGTVRKGEFDNIKDITDHDSQHRQNFQSILSALRLLNFEDFSEAYLELPYQPRCRLYMKADGNERCVLEVKFSYKGQKFALYEIDTTDYVEKKKCLSTLIVALHNKNFDKAPNEFLQDIVRGSLRWPNITFGEKITLHHPKDFYTGTQDVEMMIESWSQRIESTLEKHLFNNG